MAPKSQLTKEQRISIKVLHGEGYSTTAIASKVKCSQGAVSKTLARLKETGSTDDRKRSGRPKISSSREDRHLVHLSLQDRRLTSPQLKRQWEDTCGIVCSSRTVRKRLDNVGLHGRVAKKKPLLTERHKRIRLNLAEWNKIIWSDESKFNLVVLMEGFM